jgi:two-component system CheB/CheR fusion protein
MNKDAAPKASGREGDAKSGQKLHVVGIGASAGGIGALQKFFRAVPADTQTTFVVVMHLSPEHESHLQEVLENVAAIAVTQVHERTAMERGHIYVIPPNRNIEITDGHLIVTEFEEPRGRRAPIDVFFRTLAEVHRNGIGIVLSGSGTDGTVGMKAIKQQGGVLMVQLPEEADYDAMPTSAINTGMVDFVLPAEQLAEKAEELAKDVLYGDTAPFDASNIDEDDEATLHKILVQLQARTGHDFRGYKRSTLCRRINRRMRVAQVDTLADYLDFLRRNQSEALSLQKDFLISVTDFFRDPDVFGAVAEKIIPHIFEAHSSDDQVRVWVPGCATGEEVYSLAILLLEEADRHKSPPRFQIFATDLDEDALAYAREGRYPDAIATDVSEERLRRFFVSEGSYYRVKSSLREMVLFASHDLLRDPPFSNLSLISCRNLLIYLQRELQAKVFEVFHYALEPDGFLLLGSSESAGGTPSLFRNLDKRNRLYQRKRNTSHLAHRLPDLPLKASSRKWVRSRHRTVEPAQPGPTSDGDLHQKSLETHAPPSMLVDSNLDIVHLSERAGHFLQVPGGSPTSNAIKLARDPLRLDLRAGLQTVFDGEKSVLSAPIMLDDGGEDRTIRLYISSKEGETGQPLALVLFIETEPLMLGSAAKDKADGDSDMRAEHLVREVDRLRDQLQITSEKSDTQQEELKATNEELQSINEEYKSTLEELETSKEELQSVNEELKTVNVELKEKVDDLSHANNDLKNLMGATDVATLFVDLDLDIKLYTPALEEIFNIRRLDEGRPLSHITHRLDVDDLEGKACAVLRDLIPYEQTLEGANGKWYLMRIIAYRTTEDRIEGVILTFVDITRVRAARENLRRTQEHYELLIESVDEYAIFTMNPNGQVVSWNPGAVRLFGYTADEFLGEPAALVFTDEDRDAGIPEREMSVAREAGQTSDERWHVRKDGSTFWGRGTMTALYDDAKLRGFAKVLRDDTEKREAEEAMRHMNQTLEQKVEERAQQVRKLASELTMAEQQERRRLSQILHDSLQQRLYGIQMKMTFVRDHAEHGDREELTAYADQAWEWIVKAIETTRQLSVDLSPPVLSGDGLTDAINWLQGQMAEMHGLHIDLEAERSFHVRDQDMLVLLFHLVRELLFNVVKHAEVDHARVELFEEDDVLVIRVIDTGRGFELESVFEDAQHKGYGLFSVRERLNLFGGHLDIDTAPGEGTTVTIYVSIDESGDGVPVGLDVASEHDIQPADQ